MKLLQITFIIAVGIFLTSCEKVINVPLKTSPPKLVIDASIDWDKTTAGNEQRIRLSTTTGFYNADFPTVSGATVSITNSESTAFNFLESSNAGEYVCTDFKPEVGETYTLTVVLNGVTYTSVETLVGTPQIDDSIVQNNLGGMSGDEMEVQFSYQDDGSRDNYYMTRIQTNRVAYPQFFLENDENFQGRKMVQYYSHADLVQGDSINIKLYGTSKRFFDYFNKVVTASGNDDSPFSSTPTAVRGNIVNQIDADDYALGYFRLSEVVTRDLNIK